MKSLPSAVWQHEVKTVACENWKARSSTLKHSLPSSEKHRAKSRMSPHVSGRGPNQGIMTAVPRPPLLPRWQSLLASPIRLRHCSPVASSEQRKAGKEAACVQKPKKDQHLAPGMGRSPWPLFCLSTSHWFCSHCCLLSAATPLHASVQAESNVWLPALLARPATQVEAFGWEPHPGSR